MHRCTNGHNPALMREGRSFKKGGVDGECTQRGEVGFSVDPGGRGVVTEGRGPAGP